MTASEQSPASTPSAKCERRKAMPPYEWVRWWRAADSRWLPRRARLRSPEPSGEREVALAGPQTGRPAHGDQAAMQTEAHRVGVHAFERNSLRVERRDVALPRGGGCDGHPGQP